MRLCIGSYRNISSVFIEPTHTHKLTQIHTHSHTPTLTCVRGLWESVRSSCRHSTERIFALPLALIIFELKFMLYFSFFFNVLCNFSHLQLKLPHLLLLSLFFGVSRFFLPAALSNRTQKQTARQLETRNRLGAALLAAASAGSLLLLCWEFPWQFSLNCQFWPPLCSVGQHFNSFCRASFVLSGLHAAVKSQ